MNRYREMRVGSAWPGLGGLLGGGAPERGLWENLELKTKRTKFMIDVLQAFLASRQFP